jgi:nucleoside-diphosphate-sugar epimerase
MNKSILLTGSSGFVGSNLIPFLRKNFNYSIVTVTRKIVESEKKRIRYEELFSENKNYSSYIHLAGKAHDTSNVSNSKEYFSVNRDLTIRLYDRFLKDSKSNVFIFMSSIKAVSDNADQWLQEDHKAEPKTPYGKSKSEAEVYIINNIPADKTVVILRPCMIHGPGNKGNLNLLHSIISKGIPWPLGAYDNFRSFLSIENLCFVIKEILEGNVTSGVYNVADDGALSTTELVSIISEVSNKKSRIWKVPKTFIKMIARAGNVLPLPLNEERLEKLTENYLVSNEKIKKALGIERMPISAREGMIRTLKDFEES